MNITCPVCAAQYDLRTALNDTDGRRLLALLMDVPPELVRPLLNYLAMFKPVKSSLRWARMYSLMNDLLPMIKHRRIEHHGSTRIVPLELWVSVLTTFTENPPKTLKRPLASHGYLFEIVAASAEKAAAAHEKKREAHRHVGRSEPGGELTSLKSRLAEENG